MGIRDFFSGRGTLDQIDAAFQRLEANRVMARLYPGSGRSQGYQDIRSELADAERQGKTFEGFCFCDAHSFEALDEGALTLNFGSAHAHPTYRATWSAQLQTGQLVARALAEAGFNVAWDGDPASVIAIVDVKWKGPREKPGVTGAKLSLDCKPRPPAQVTMTTVFVDGAVPGALPHRLLARIADLKGTKMFGGTDGQSSAAVDYDAGGRLFDLVTGATAAGPIGRYLLQTRDLLAECALLLDVVERTDSPAGAWWTSGNFEPSRRVRLVLTGSTDARYDGSPAVAIGDDLASLSGALKVLEDLATAES